MNIRFLGFILCFLMGGFCFGHNPRETFSTLKVQDAHLVFHLELPWSLTPAVIKRFPEMDKHAGKDSFYAYIKKYVIENIAIRKGKGQPVAAKQIMIEEETNHILIVNLRYPLTDIGDLHIRNTLLFNLDSDITNHHRLVLVNGRQSDFSTTKTQPFFTTPANGKHRIAKGFLIVLPFVMGLLPLVLLLNKRPTRHNCKPSQMRRHRR